MLYLLDGALQERPLSQGQKPNSTPIVPTPVPFPAPCFSSCPKIALNSQAHPNTDLSHTTVNITQSASTLEKIVNQRLLEITGDDYK